MKRRWDLGSEKDGVVWNTDPKKTPELIFAEGTYRFLDAEEISHEVYSFGVGCGIRSRYAGFAGTPYAFETIIWIEAVDETFGWSGFRSARRDCIR